jgi:hypothetical protein
MQVLILKVVRDCIEIVQSLRDLGLRPGMAWRVEQILKSKNASNDADGRLLRQ